LVGYVAQEPFVLDDTVRRNVAFGQSDADIDDDRVWRCLEQARLGDHVRRLNGGLDALLGERGGRFSGGERQRLAIARALYADPQILVFDEATSALDPRTEGEVAESIVSLARTTTVVVIAHRRRTIAACAQLLLLEHGRMLAHGDANALLQNAGPVHDLMRETHLEPAR
jgi:ABC-type multidrug transport system fused ATPase/permease subunit